MREIQLLTETSTQIRVSVRPKAPHLPNKWGAEDDCRNSAFWQVFSSQAFPDFQYGTSGGFLQALIPTP
jgi:hypothetical protein